MCFCVLGIDSPPIIPICLLGFFVIFIGLSPLFGIGTVLGMVIKGHSLYALTIEFRTLVIV